MYVVLFKTKSNSLTCTCSCNVASCMLFWSLIMGVFIQKIVWHWLLFTCYQTANQRCSLLVVDRTLDLCGPTSHQTDCLADRIIGVLNHLTQSSSDVCVNMSPIAPTCGHTSSDGVEERVGVVNGCLAQPGDRKGRQLLQTLICSKQKVFVAGSCRKPTLFCFQLT